MKDDPILGLNQPDTPAHPSMSGPYYYNSNHSINNNAPNPADSASHGSAYHHRSNSVSSTSTTATNNNGSANNQYHHNHSHSHHNHYHHQQHQHHRGSNIDAAMSNSSSNHNAHNGNSNTSHNNNNGGSSNSNSNSNSFAPYPAASSDGQGAPGNPATSSANPRTSASFSRASGSGLSTVSPHLAGMNMYGIYGSGLGPMGNPGSIMSTPEMGEQAGLLPPPSAPSLGGSPHNSAQQPLHGGMVGLDGMAAPYMQHLAHSQSGAPVVPLASGLPGVGMNGNPLLHHPPSSMGAHHSAHHHQQQQPSHHAHHAQYSQQAMAGHQHYQHAMSLNNVGKAAGLAPPPMAPGAIPPPGPPPSSANSKPRLPVPYQPSKEASAQVVAAAAASGIETADPQALQHPTYIGFIKTAVDAILLLAACDQSVQTGKAQAGTEVELAEDGLPRPRRVTRRLLDGERASLIHSGSIFVWDEKEAGMRRWTDGRCWSASRVSGCFLTYRELEGKKKTPAQAALLAAQTGKPNTGGTSNTYKQDGLIKQSFSITTLTGRKLHIISYYTKRDVRENRLRKLHEDPHFRRALIASASLFANGSNISLPLPTLPPASKKARANAKGKGSANGQDGPDYDGGVVQWAEMIDENEYQDPTTRSGEGDENDTLDQIPGRDNRSGDEGASGGGRKPASGGSGGNSGVSGNNGGSGVQGSVKKEEGSSSSQTQSKRKRGGADSSKSKGNGNGNGNGYAAIAASNGQYNPHAYVTHETYNGATVGAGSRHSSYSGPNILGASRSGSGSSASGSAYSLSLSGGGFTDGSNNTAATSPVFPFSATSINSGNVPDAPSATSSSWGAPGWYNGKMAAPPLAGAAVPGGNPRAVLQSLHRGFSEHGQQVLQSSGTLARGGSNGSGSTGLAGNGTNANNAAQAGSRTTLPSLNSFSSGLSTSSGPRGLAGGGSGSSGPSLSSLPPVGHTTHRSSALAGKYTGSGGGAGAMSAHALVAERPPLKRRYADGSSAVLDGAGLAIDGSGGPAAKRRSLPPLRPGLGPRKRSSSSGELELAHMGGGRLPTLKSLRTRRSPSPSSAPRIGHGSPRSAGGEHSPSSLFQLSGVASSSTRISVTEDDLRLPPLSGGWTAPMRANVGAAPGRGPYLSLSMSESSVREEGSDLSNSASAHEFGRLRRQERQTLPPWQANGPGQELLTHSQSRAEQESAVGALLSLRSGSASGSGSGSRSGSQSGRRRGALSNASGSGDEDGRSAGTPSPVVSASAADGEDDAEGDAPLYLGPPRQASAQQPAQYRKDASVMMQTPVISQPPRSAALPTSSASPVRSLSAHSSSSSSSALSRGQNSSSSGASGVPGSSMSVATADSTPMPATPADLQPHPHHHRHRTNSSSGGMPSRLGVMDIDPQSRGSPSAGKKMTATTMVATSAAEKTLSLQATAATAETLA